MKETLRDGRLLACGVKESQVSAALRQCEKRTNTDSGKLSHAINYVKKLQKAIDTYQDNLSLHSEDKWELLILMGTKRPEIKWLEDSKVAVRHLWKSRPESLRNPGGKKIKEEKQS